MKQLTKKTKVILSCLLPVIFLAIIITSFYFFWRPSYRNFYAKVEESAEYPGYFQCYIDKDPDPRFLDCAGLLDLLDNTVSGLRIWPRKGEGTKIAVVWSESSIVFYPEKNLCVYYEDYHYPFGESYFYLDGDALLSLVKLKEEIEWT